MDVMIAESSGRTPWWLGALVVVGVTVAALLLPLYAFLHAADALGPARLGGGGPFDAALVLGALFGLAGIGRRYTLRHARHR